MDNLKDELTSVTKEHDQLKTQLEMEQLKTLSVGSNITPIKRKTDDPHSMGVITPICEPTCEQDHKKIDLS